MVEMMADLLAVASAGSGLWAAWLWWRSTRVLPFNPQWATGREPDTSETNWRAETALFMRSMCLARELTGRAALWATAAVALHAFAALLWRITLPG